MKRTTKKKRTRRHFSDDEKRAIVAEITPENTLYAVAFKHRLQRATLSAWRKRFARGVASPPPATNRNGSAALLQIQGLDALVRSLVRDELGPIVERELPAALERALARAYGGKSGGKST